MRRGRGEIALDLEWSRLLRAQRGEEAAWRALIESHQNRLTTLALLITGSSQAAEDVVQETFIRALRSKLKNYAGTVAGYLGTIAYRLAMKESKRSRRNIEINQVSLFDTKETPLGNILEDERDKLVARAIGELDNDHRSVIVLRFYGGHSYDEIAEIMKIPIGTVKSRIFYAVKSCRDSLRRKGVL